MGGPDMGGLILYGACNGGPGVERNVPNPAPKFGFYRFQSFLFIVAIVITISLSTTSQSVVKIS